MASYVSWNCGGLRKKAVNSTKKGEFLKRKVLEELKGTTVVALQETHFQNDQDICQEIEDLKSIYNFYHSFANENDKFAGVSLLLTDDYEVRQISETMKGRILVVETIKKAQGEVINFVVVYGYHKGVNTDDRLGFLQILRSSLLQNRLNFIMGDFNFVTNILDRSESTMRAVEKRMASLMQGICSDFELTDPFRIIEPLKRRYSYGKGNKKSRIDRFYIPIDKEGTILKQSFHDTLNEDHKLISLMINAEVKRGSGTWCLNTDLLRDPTYKRVIHETLLETLEIREKFRDIKEFWDIFKQGVKRESMYYSKEKVKAKQALEKEINDQIERLENQGEIQEQGLNSLAILKKKKREIEFEKSEGYRIRSRIPHFEENEPNISYYARMEKNRGEKNIIYALKDENGIIREGTEDVLKVSEIFYQKLFKEEPVDENLQNEILAKTKKKVNKNNEEFMEQPITLEELEAALKALPNGKSPGLDGLPKEFYVTFWQDLKHLFLELTNNIFATGQLAKGQETTAVKILFKKTDRLNLKFYRPISLLNADLKIITKALATRLSKILPSLINEGQTCIPGRNISDNIHTIMDVIKMANSKNLTAAVIMLDQEKAFDRVNHGFLMKTLKHFGFGPYFRKWVEILYTNIYSRIKINGFLTNPIPIQRGVRQGCPLSALLYVLIGEVLGNLIRENPKIKGIKLKDRELKILQYADDTSLFLLTDASIFEARKDIHRYENASGAKLNETKTKGLWLGSNIGRTDSPCDFEYTSESLECLGIFVGNNDTTQLNLEGQIEKIKQKLIFWKGRRLSRIGKIKAINIYLLSRLWYRTEVMEISKEMIQKIEKDMLEFIWSGSPNREASKNDLKGSFSDGGLQLVCIQTKVDAQRIKYISKLLNSQPFNLLKLAANEVIGDHEDGYSGVSIFQADSRTKFNLDPFYRSCLSAWRRISYNKEIPRDKKTIEHENLYHNPLIRDENGNTLQPSAFLTRNDIYKVKDLEKRNVSKVIRTRIAKIKCLLPKEWDTRIQTCRPLNQSLLIESKPVKLNKVTTSKLYKHLVKEIQLNESYKAKWEDYFNTSQLDWNELWARVKKIKNDKIRSDIWSQIRLNFWSPYLAVNQRRYLETGEICFLCGKIQISQRHIIISCEVTERLWNQISTLLQDLLSINIEEEEMCFGLKSQRTVLKLRNYISFTLRSTIHSHRNDDIKNATRAEELILKAFKHNLKNDLKIKFATAYTTGGITDFEESYLIKNILGKIVSGRFILCDFLESPP